MIMSTCRWCRVSIEWVGAVAKWRSAADGSFKCGDFGLWHMRVFADWTLDRVLVPPTLPAGDDEPAGLRMAGGPYPVGGCRSPVPLSTVQIWCCVRDAVTSAKHGRCPNYLISTVHPKSGAVLPTPAVPATAEITTARGAVS